MKRITALVIGLLFIIVSLHSPAVNAANALEVSIETEDSVTHGKPFYVYLKFENKDDIGAVNIDLCYDEEKLFLKKAELTDKIRDDVFRSNDMGGRVRMVMSVAGNVSESKTVRLRFYPKEDIEQVTYCFFTDNCNACNAAGDYIYEETMPVLDISISGDKTEVSYSRNEVSYGTNQSRDSRTSRAGSSKTSSSLSGNTSSKNNSSASKEQSGKIRSVSEYDNSNDPEVLSENDGTNNSGSEEFHTGNNNTIYIEDKNDISISDQKLLIWGAGLVIIFSIIVYIAYRKIIKASRSDKK